MIDAFLLAILAGATGGLVVGAPAALVAWRRRPPRPEPAALADLRPGRMIVDESGWQWVVLTRRQDASADGGRRLSVDLRPLTTVEGAMRVLGSTEGL